MASPSPSVHPQFRSKAVCTLTCRHCLTDVCRRGMKAILLGDTRVELYSTDFPPAGVQLVEKDYMTRNCRCRIRDVACLGCGNVIGYHVTQPCEMCLDACNNGHFWMFLAEGVRAIERKDPSGMKNLLWANLPCYEHDVDAETRKQVICR
ncbi:protein FAM72 [Cladochytrium replicatum]|nr:protein FAM72 [Cladochytrium replicatum]